MAVNARARSLARPGRPPSVRASGDARIGATFTLANLPPHTKKSSVLRSDVTWRAWRAFWVLAVVVIFAQAAYTRFTLPQWTILTPDSGYYVNPALLGKIVEMGPRTIPYPLFCWSLLATTGDWRSLAMTQHILGLLGPALLLLAWYYLGSRIHVARLMRAGHELLGLVILLLLLPSASYVLYEHMAMLESFNAFFQCCLCAVFCLLWLPASPRRRVLICCVASFLGIAIYYTNPRWALAAPLTVLIAGMAAMSGRDRARSWFRAVGPVVASAAAAWLLIGLPQSRIQALNPWTKPFATKHLLWMHADLAAVEFSRDLAATPAPPNAALLRTLVAKIDRAMVGEGKSGWVTLPFNAEAMLYAADNPDGDLIAAFANDPEGYGRFCLDYYLRMMRHQPLAFGTKVAKELGYFYTGWGGSLVDYSTPLEAYWKNSVVIARALAQAALPGPREQLLAAASAMEPLAAQSPGFTSPAYLSQAGRLINIWLGVSTLVGAVASVVILSRRQLRANQALAISAGLCLTASSALFAQMLTLAMVTAAATRYTEAVRTLVVFSVVALMLLGANAAVVFGKKRLSRPLQA